MPAPTFVNEYESAWNSSTSPKTASITTQTNDRLVVGGIVESNGQAVNTPTGGTGLSWTLVQSIAVASYTNMYVFTTTDAGAGQTFTLSVSKAAGSLWYGFNCFHFRASDGFGASSKTNVASGAPSLGLTTTQDNSAICVFNGDWSSQDGTSRTWNTSTAGTATERTYFRDASHYAAYAATYLDAGATGAETVGLTAPGTQKYSIIAVEVKGTAGAPAQIPTLVMARSA